MMTHEDQLLKDILDATLEETQQMITRDHSPAGRRAALTHALTEPGRKAERIVDDDV